MLITNLREAPLEWEGIHNAVRRALPNLNQILETEINTESFNPTGEALEDIHYLLPAKFAKNDYLIVLYVRGGQLHQAEFDQDFLNKNLPEEMNEMLKELSEAYNIKVTRTESHEFRLRQS